MPAYKNRTPDVTLAKFKHCECTQINSLNAPEYSTVLVVCFVHTSGERIVVFHAAPNPFLLNEIV